MLLISRAREVCNDRVTQSYAKYTQSCIYKEFRLTTDLLVLFLPALLFSLQLTNLLLESLNLLPTVCTCTCKCVQSQKTHRNRWPLAIFRAFNSSISKMADQKNAFECIIGQSNSYLIDMAKNNNCRQTQRAYQFFTLQNVVCDKHIHAQTHKRAQTSKVLCSHTNFNLLSMIATQN